MKAYILCLLYFSLIACEPNVLKDVDGNKYKTVRIGSQIWMAENLKVTKFRDGTPITYISDPLQWMSTSVAAYCYYDNQPEYAHKYGNLYNWHAMNSEKGLAPKGWRIPTEEDIRILVNYLRGDTIAGGQLKQPGVLHWYSLNKTGKDTVGFSALPSGYRNGNDGQFYTLGGNAYWWNQNQSYEIFSWSNRFYNTFADVKRDTAYKKFALAVRCIKE